LLSESATAHFLLIREKMMRRFLTAIVMFTICAVALADSALTVPEKGRPALWEAESGKPGGAWKKNTDETASAGAYMSHEDGGTTSVLEFSFSVERPMSLRLIPLWWRNSEEKTARRFPKSLSYFEKLYVWPAAAADRRRLSSKPQYVKELPGPDKIVALGGKLYFNAPSSGILGILDPVSEKIIGQVKLGGYIADILADPKTSRIFATDPANGAVVVYDTKTGTVLKRIPVAAIPYALAQSDGCVFVGCIEGKKLIKINAESLAIEKSIDLPFKPQGLAVIDGALVVWPLAEGFDPDTGKPADLDRIAWARETTLTWTDPSHIIPNPIKGKRGGFKNGYFPRGMYARYRKPGKLQIVARQYMANPRQGGGGKKIDFIINIPELGDGPEPNISSLVNYNKLLYFLVPGQDSLYSIDASQPGPPRKIKIGNPVAITVFAGRSDGRYYEFCLGKGLKVKQTRPRPTKTIKPILKETFIFVADSSGKQIHVINPANGSTLRKIPTKGEPTDVFVSGRYLYASCANPNEILKIDIGTNKVIKRMALSAPARRTQVFYLAKKAVSWTPTPPLSEWPKRVIAHLKPVAYDPVTLEAKGFPDVPFLPATRYSATVVVGSKTKEFWCDNMHVIGINAEKHINTSALTDTLAGTELSNIDAQGTIAFSIDDGPKHDWMAGIFLTRQRWHVARGTEEFDTYNAPVISVPAGRHILKVHSKSRWARLDGLKVREVLDAGTDVALCPEPSIIHSKVPLPSYRGVFANWEQVKFSANVTGEGAYTATLKLSWTVMDFIGEKVSEGTASFTDDRAMIEIPLKETGLFTLRTDTTDSNGASTVRFAHFTRLPNLAHPTLLYDKSDEKAIRARIKEHAKLFERYRLWIRRNVSKPGFLPKRMGGGVSQTYVKMEARWRALGCALSVLFLEKDASQKKLYVNKIAPIMGSGHQEGFEHAWEFAGASAVMYDMLAGRYPIIAAYTGPEKRVSYKDHLLLITAKSDHIAETLMAADEPLSPKERSFLDQQLRAIHNVIHYARTHGGERGGNWWQGTRTNCGCSLQGVFRTLLYFQGFLGYDIGEFFQAPFFSKAFIHAQYATPHFDKRKVIKRALALRSPGHHGTGGKITAMLASLLTDNPVERKLYDVNDWITKMNGPLGGNETGQVDKLMAEVNMHVIPIFLALGYYDTKAPQLDFDDLPPSMLFDVEGEACMKSDWTPEMTDVYFVSGARDVTYRVEPNHLRIYKGGHLLLGTRARQGDHGDPVPSWGNVVLMGTKTPPRWQFGAHWPRMNQRVIVDRFSPQVFSYNMRDYSLSNVRPMNSPWRNYDGIILHSHSEHKFHKPGRIMAYETSTDYDYVAGDATCAWPLGQVEENFRQVVFVRPDIIVVYDRVKLGKNQDRTRWQASTAANLAARGNRFSIVSGKAKLEGIVLAPKKAALSTSNSILSFEGPTNPDKRVEYLVVFQTGVGRIKPVNAKLIKTARETGADINFKGEKIKVLFSRIGAVGGKISVGAVGDKPFIQKTDHSYRGWKNHYMFKKWMQNPLLAQYITDEDIKEFGSMALPDIKAPPKKVYVEDPRGISKGQFHCDGASAFRIAGSKCPNFEFPGDFLIQARFKFNKAAPFATTSHNYAIMMKGMYGGPLFQVAVRPATYRGLFARGRTSDNKGYRDILPKTNMSKTFLDGNFHTLAYVRKGKAGMLYIDGVKVGELPNFDTNVKNNRPFEVGKGCQDSYFEGVIDDVRLWRFDSGLPAKYEDGVAAYEKSRDEIPAALKNAPGVKYSIYTFDDRDGSRTASDKGNNGYDMTYFSD